MPLGMAARMWPTPQASDWKHPGLPRRGTESNSAHGLAARVMWPTPSAGGSHSVGRMDEWGGSWNWTRQLPIEERRGLLNPTWVEWLMGFPPEWTDCEHLATPSFRKSLSSSGDASSPKARR